MWSPAQVLRLMLTLNLKNLWIMPQEMKQF